MKYAEGQELLLGAAREAKPGDQSSNGQAGTTPLPEEVGHPSPGQEEGVLALQTPGQPWLW